jgi:hypothetical protein
MPVSARVCFILIRTSVLFALRTISDHLVRAAKYRLNTRAIGAATGMQIRRINKL